MEYTLTFFPLICTILSLAFIILLEKYRLLKITSSKKIQELEKNCQKLQDILNKKEHSYKLYLERNQEEQNIENDLFDNPSKFYGLKPTCMTPMEAGMFFYIYKALENIIPNENKRKNYFVFPQVALHSFVNIHKTIENDNPTVYNIARRNFVAKSVDFIICYHYSEKRPYMNYSDHYYKPLLLIEIDGNSHFSPKAYGKENLLQQQKRDHFKNQLTEDLNIPLLRYVPDKIKNPDENEKQSRPCVCPKDLTNIQYLLQENLKIIS